MATTGIRAGANASDTRLAFVPEAAWATTPATPAFELLRFTGENIQPAKATVRSNEIRPDRNVTDEILVGRNVAGNADFELSYGTFDPILESLFFSEWDDDVIKNGAGAGQSFTAERTLRLEGGSSHYARFLGLVANSMSLSITAGQLVTGSFDFMGKFGGAGTAAIAGATYAEAPQSRVINAASHFAALSVSGIAEAPPIRSLSLSMTNNLRQQQAVGETDAIGIGAGRFEVTGSMEAYFKSGALLQAFLDHDDLSLAFTLGTEVGSRYRITIPTIVLTGSPGGNASSNNDDVMATMAFTAVFDRISAEPIGATVQIERGV
ncbi:phage tail tube protein [Aliihoeflea sp. PC F10.4]